MRIKTIGLVILCVILTANAFGQLKAITKAAYDTARENAYKKVESQLRRVVTEKTNYKGNKVDSTESLTIESQVNGDSRWTGVTNKDGKVIDNFQLIYLGNYEYRKQGSAEWTKRCVKNCSKAELASGDRMMISGTQPPRTEEFLMSETTISGQAATLLIFYRVYQLGKTLNFYDDRMWIGANGQILKAESLTSDVFPGNKTTHEVSSYEYDPKDVIPLEPPIK